MAELPDHETDFARLLHGLPFDDGSRPDHAEHLREQALAMFASQPAQTPIPWWKRALMQGREIMRRPIPRLLAGAACLVMLAGWLLLPNRFSTAQAFQQLADAVVQAKTARFQMEVTYEGQPKMTVQVLYQAP